jgi:D-proline reductase (dithiol) PrdB
VTEFKRLTKSRYEQKFDAWREVVDKMHANSVFTANESVAFTRLSKPLSECRLALASTAGVRLKSQPPFDLEDERGDWSWRRIPGDVDVRDVIVEHIHYDTTDANEDPNVVFPIDALRSLARDGTVGDVSTLHAGLTGWIPDGTPLKEQTAPEVAHALKDADVDAVVLTPG